MLNFHFTSAAPAQQQNNNNNTNRRRSQNSQFNNNQQYNNRRRSQQDRSSARRKPNSHLFNLHSSTDHAFVIKRHGMKQQQYSLSGCDEPVSWESVCVVKYQVPTDPQATCCPICLDNNLVCARITKCGHFYCLPCLLRHIQVHAQSNPYDHVKCPCCAVPLHVPDLRPVLLTTSLPPKLHQRMKLVKLHRTKDCPSPYLPRPEAFKRSSSHAAPCVTDVDAPYCRFNYMDPIVYQEHLVTNKVELEMELSNLATRRQQIQIMHPRQQKFHHHQAEVEAIFLTSSLDVVRKEFQKALEEFDQEQELADSYSGVGSGVCQHQPHHLMASNYEFTVLPQATQEEKHGRVRGNSIGSEVDSLQQCASGDHSTDGEGRAFAERHRSESIGSEGESSIHRYRGDSIGSYASVDGQNSQATQSCDGTEEALPLSPTQQKQQKHGGGKRISKPRKKLEFPQASMYLDNEGSTQFYQCEDGQLCFLSRFNMSCLLSDFSTKVPDQEALRPGKALNFWQRRRLLPLPDSVEGEIIEIESIRLTPEIRKRLPFLAHLPLYTDIRFVEIDLNNLLSMETKRKFKADFEKRRKRRQSKIKAEKREDKMARKLEEERINELKARMHQIDPDDEFFQVAPPPEEPLDLTSEAFGPAISGSQNGELRPTPAVAAAAPSFSFSNVTQSGGAFPALSTTNSEANFPSLGASAPSRRTPPAPTWGSPSRSKTSAAAASPTSGPGVAEVSKPAVPGPKKKSKGKKIVLFSTGGQRGTTY